MKKPTLEQLYRQAVRMRCLHVQIQQPDLAIVDWMLPERSGVDVCRSLRAQADSRKLPIIMLTSA